MHKARPSYAGGIAAELITLRAEYARLKPLDRVVKSLRQVVSDQARENLELRRALYRANGRQRVPSNRRRDRARNGGSELAGEIAGSEGAAG